MSPDNSVFNQYNDLLCGPYVDNHMIFVNNTFNTAANSVGGTSGNTLLITIGISHTLPLIYDLNIIFKGNTFINFPVFTPVISITSPNIQTYLVFEDNVIDGLYAIAS